MNAIEEKITYENRMQDVTNTNEVMLRGDVVDELCKNELKFLGTHFIITTFCDNSIFWVRQVKMNVVTKVQTTFET